MALSTYSELKTAIAGWLRRTNLTDQIPDFITLCEAQFNRRLRLSPMVERADAVLDTEYGALPGQMISPVRFIMQTDPLTELRLVSAERLEAMKAARTLETSTKPEYWAIVGEQYQLYPAPGTAYTGQMTYWKKVPALSDASPTNWLLTEAPDLYLYGSLMQSAPYLRSDERIETWASFYRTAVGDLQRRYRVSNPTTLRSDELVLQHHFDITRGI